MAGRKPRYRPEYAQQAYVACAEAGMTDIQLAKLFGVGKTTVNMWKKKYPEFYDSILQGRDLFDSSKVERSLLKRALGYSYTETTKEPVEVPDPETGEVKRELQQVKKVTKHIPPEPSAARYWLNNRQPARWKNVKHVELTGENGGPIEHNVNFEQKLRDAKNRAQQARTGAGAGTRDSDS